MKKIIFIIIGIVVLLAAGFFVVSRFFSPPALLTPPETSQQPPPLSPASGSRSYFMGLSLLAPPSTDPDSFIPKKISVIAEHTDALIEHPDVPWKGLLAGKSPDELVNITIASPVKPARSKGLKVFIMLEPLNGLDRRLEAAELVKAGRSIKEAAVQDLYRQYALAVARVIKPDYLGLAAEVNLFKQQGPAASYRALVMMVNKTRQEVKRQNPGLPLYFSVSVEGGWGGAAASRKFSGIEAELSDFPSFDALGFSVYPLTLYGTPEEIPSDYFSRLLGGRKTSVLIDESGWPSAFSQKSTSPEMQARWIKKLGQLADPVNTKLLAQVITNDMEPAIIAANPGAEFFASQGIFDYRLNPKPALEEWDELFKRHYKN